MYMMAAFVKNLFGSLPSEETHVDPGTAFLQQFKDEDHPPIYYAPCPSARVYQALEQARQQVEASGSTAEFSNFLSQHGHAVFGGSKLQGLYNACISHPNKDISEHFTSKILPKIMSHAIRLPELFPYGLPLLETPGVIDLTDEQVACVVANMFCCTLKSPLKKDYPNSSFATWLERPSGRHVPKLQCALQYFAHIFDSSTGNQLRGVSKLRIRRCASAVDPPEKLIDNQNFTVLDMPDLSDATKPLLKLEVEETSMIDDHKDCIQVDFANRFLGGGVLGLGSVQEEIHFAKHPELLGCMILCKVMEDFEALVLSGATCFAKTSGYAATLCYDKAAYEEAPPLIAIDALNFSGRGHWAEYRPHNIDREIRKSLTGFAAGTLVAVPECDSAQFTDIATGHWGCGAFKGTKLLKAILQWIAASQASRNLRYSSFGTWEDKPLLEHFVQALRRCNATVGELYQALKQEVNPDKGHRSRDLTEKIQSLQRKLEANASSKRE